MLKLAKWIRDAYLVNIRWRHYDIGEGFHAGARVRMWAKNNITIGCHFYIGRGSQIECDCQIGNYVLLGNNVAIVGRHDHHYQQIGVPIRMADSIRDERYDWTGIDERVTIGNDVWVGYGVIILSGVTIGSGSIVAAGSIVNKDVDPFSIYAGVPARKVKSRFESDADVDAHLAGLRKAYPNTIW